MKTTCPVVIFAFVAALFGVAFGWFLCESLREPERPTMIVVTYPTESGQQELMLRPCGDLSSQWSVTFVDSDARQHSLPVRPLNDSPYPTPVD